MAKTDQTPHFLKELAPNPKRYDAFQKKGGPLLLKDYAVPKHAKLFEHTNVVITGGAVGIGRGITLTAAAEGGAVFFHYVSSEKAAAREVVTAIKSGGGKVQAFCGDLSDAVVRKSFFAAAVKFFAGRVHVLINNAGITYNEELTATSDEIVAKLLGVNLIAPTLLTRDFGKVMGQKEGGVIVNFTSLHAKAPAFGHSVYGITKRGLEALTAGAALELGQQKNRVRVFGVQPGWVISENHFKAEGKGFNPATAAESLPLGRAMLPHEMGRAVVLLIAYFTDIHGDVIPIHGGLGSTFPGIPALARSKGRYGRRYM